MGYTCGARMEIGLWLKPSFLPPIRFRMDEDTFAKRIDIGGRGEGVGGGGGGGSISLSEPDRVSSSMEDT